MTTGKLWELAALPDMPSAPTLRQLMRERPDFPIVERGRKGRDYVIDIEDAAAFVRANWRDARSTLSGKARASRSHQPDTDQLRLF
ncbi:conserved hypothetical protein [Sphingomonas sp. EC-HK361]|uniref:hypothetical protein n=1 Tax=Sphingomonas sp. EC-HK361 TaxID=2038397 RepID=UPI0012590E73|nr:hypothetical protein [Sphingomonas sp. EC-HK361]VVT16405.1 conserved hypothetical protein [Sphingomonas sp. EC-HK361]